jgi:hypothetical protein
MTVPTSQIGNYFRANVLAVAVGATGTTTRGFSISTLASTASSSGGNVAASALATAAPTDTADSASAPPPTATEVDPSVAPTDVQTPSDDGSPDYVEGGGAGAGAVTEQAVTLGGSSAVVEPAASAPQSAGSNMFCTEKMKHDYGRQHTVVGQTGAWTNRVSHSFVYTTGSSSKLGYAVSTSGGAGTYTAGQTTNKTSASTQYYPSQGAWTYALYRTDFDYRKYFVHCVYGGLIDYDEYEVRPAKFLGGTSIVHPGTMPSTNQCSHYAPGSGLLKASTKAITWTNGVQFTGANLGVSLSSETGYTKTAEVKFRVGLTAVNGRDLCGHGDYPVGTPYLIVAKT